MTFQRQRRDDPPPPDLAALHYGRVLLKLSGEMLAGEQKFGIHPPVVDRLTDEIKEVHDMANVIRNSVMKFNLDSVTDEELDTIIANTQAQQASLTQFYNSLINERVRRGLKLPERRFLEDDLPASF